MCETMLCEYFRSSWFAWLGLSVLVGHSLFAAWLKRRLNEWYGYAARSRARGTVK